MSEPSAPFRAELTAAADGIPPPPPNPTPIPTPILKPAPPAATVIANGATGTRAPVCPATLATLNGQFSAEPDIPLHDFLNLLSNVYQLADSWSSPPPSSSSPGCQSAPPPASPGLGVDWFRLADDGVLKQLFDRALDDGEQDPYAAVVAVLMRKLTDFLQEGVLDAVLPYLASRIVDGPAGTSGQVANPRPSPSQVPQPSQSKESRRRNKSLTASASAQQDTGKPDFEVEIHVCDEVKNAKKDFRCPQKLLVSKMGYFAEVTVGQKLEDMDISVHCDLAIFDWLMRWVKKDLLPRDAAPVLDVSNAVPILVSAAFLQMDPLLDDCLQFCQTNLNAILRSSTNLGCLNDNILSRLAALCKNTEVDSLKDKKDRIQSRLFCKLISALAEPRPDPKRGHYGSLSAVFRCQRCGKIVPINNNGQATVPCRPDCSRLDGFDGAVYGMHVRDSSWNVTDYVRETRSEQQSWRKTYWRLWADCHFQVCSLCGHLYSARLRRFCRFHAQPPQFFGVNSQRGATYSIGRYSCCSQRAFRFEPIDSQSGCQYRNHQPLMRNPSDEEIEKILQTHSSVICIDPPVETPPSTCAPGVISAAGDANGSRRDAIWWEGLEFAPPRGRHGLLGRMWESYRRRAFRTGNVGAQEEAENGKPTAGASTTSTSGAPVSESATGASSTHSMDSSPSSSSSEDNQEIASTASSDEEESAPVRTRQSSRPSVGASIGASRRRRGFGRRGSVAACSQRSTKEPLGSSSGSSAAPESLFHWSEKVSTRTNQDNQRESEERATRFMVSLLTRRTSANHSCHEIRRHHHHSSHRQCNHNCCCDRSSRSSHHHLTTPAGGSYPGIEAAWREEQAAAGAAGQMTAAAATVTGGSSGLRAHQGTTAPRPRSKGGR